MSNVRSLVQPQPGAPVVLLASSRSDGNTFTLARMVLPEEAAPLVDLGALNISYYSYSHANATDDFIPLVEKLLGAPTWVLATPLYWYSMSAQAKTFLDRLSDLLAFRKSLGQRLCGRSLAVLCTGTDPQLPSSFEQPFELTAKYLGMAYVGTFYAQFEERSLVEPSIIGAAQALGRALLEEASNPSIERTFQRPLRALWPAAHVKR